MQLKGIIHHIGDTVQKSEKFKSRDLIVSTAENPSYPQLIKIEAGQDKCSLLDTLKIGDEVEVDFNLNGRSWTNPKDGSVSYFNSLALWKFNVLTTGSNPAPVAAPVLVEASADDDDLPF